MATVVRIYFSKLATNRSPLTEGPAQRYGMITSSSSPKLCFTPPLPGLRVPSLSCGTSTLSI